MATRGYVRSSVVGRRTGLGPWSQPAAARLPIRPTGPSAPSGISATGALESIRVTWTAPTTNAAGDPLGLGALAGYRIYISASPGIDIIDPGTYDELQTVDATEYHYTVPDPGSYLGPYYFVIVSRDVSGNISAASSEVSASANATSVAPPDPEIDDHAANVSHVLVGNRRIFLKFTLPKSTWVRWSHYNVYYDIDDGAGWSGSWTYIASERVGFMHAPLNTSYLYRYKVTVVAEDGDETDGTTHDNAGAGYQPNETDQTNLLADVVAAQHIFASGDIVGRTLIGGTLQSLDWGTAAGSQFSLENAGDIKLGGSSSPKLHWDGTAGTLAIEGSVTITGGSGIASLTDAGSLATANDVDFNAEVTGAEKPENNATVGADWESNLSNIPGTLGTPSGSGLFLSSTHLGYYDSPNWKTFMDNSGNFYLGGTGGKLQWNAGTNSLSIEGSVTITSGSGIANLTDAGSLATKNAVSASDCDTTIIDGGKIITGLLTASNITTGTMYANRISGGTIGSCTISANNITTGTMSAARITTGTMYANRISGGTIGSCTISANNITTGTMSASRISITNLSDFTSSMGTVTSGNLGGSNRVSIDSSGLDVGSSGRIRGGKPSYGSSTAGFWLGYDSTKYKFDIGSSSRYMRWTGSNLEVRGKITTESGSTLSADYITTGEMSADHITTGTLIAVAIKSHSGTGRRLELRTGAIGSTGFPLDIYNTYNNAVTQIGLGSEGGNIRLCSDGGTLTMELAGLGGCVYCREIRHTDDLTVDIYGAALDNVTGRVSVEDTQVYNGSAPTSWTTLNLSSYVGSREAVVYLMLNKNSLGGIKYWVRKQGSGRDTEQDSSKAAGMMCSDCENYNWVGLLCSTDSSGRIEWQANNSGSTRVRLISFWN